MTPRLKAVMEKLERAALPTFDGIELSGPNVKGRHFGDTPLHIMAIWGDTEAIQALIDEGADLEAHGEDGYTPLHYAVEQMKIPAVRMLLESGASPYSKMSDGTDAFALAEIHRYSEISEILNERRKGA